MNESKSKCIRRAGRKTRGAILGMERECEKTRDMGECDKTKCSKCELNRKFTNLVGMSMDEFSKYEPVRLEKGKSY